MYNPIKIKHFRKVKPEDWNHFCDRSDSAWVHHLWEWQDLMSKSWPGNNLSFAVGEDGKMTGILPVFQMAGNPGLVDSVFGYGGFAYSGSHSKMEILKVVLATIRNFYWNTLNVRGDHFFRMTLPQFFDANEIDYQEYINTGFKDCSNLTRLIDLSQDEDTIFAGYSATTRNNIRNAEKAGIICTELDTDEWTAKTYYGLHISTYGRNNLDPHPLEYFLSLHTVMKKWYRCFAAYDTDGKTLTMANVASYKRKAFYGTAASAEGATATNAAKVLQWFIMRALKASGVDTYNIGDVFPDAKPEDGKLYGLTRFKSSFGGTTVPSRKVIASINDILL